MDMHHVLQTMCFGLWKQRFTCWGKAAVDNCFPSGGCALCERPNKTDILLPLASSLGDHFISRYSCNHTTVYFLFIYVFADFVNSVTVLKSGCLPLAVAIYYVLTFLYTICGFDIVSFFYFVFNNSNWDQTVLKIQMINGLNCPKQANPIFFSFCHFAWMSCFGL